MNRILRFTAATVLLPLALTVPFSVVASGAGAVDAAWLKAIAAGDAAAATACYAPDAVVWLPGAPVSKGKSAIRASYDAYFAAYTVKDSKMTELGSRTVGNDSVSWGTFSMTNVPKAGGEPMVETGRYTEVARKIGGKWVYLVDHASDDAAPASAP